MPHFEESFESTFPAFPVPSLDEALEGFMQPAIPGAFTDQYPTVGELIAIFDEKRKKSSNKKYGAGKAKLTKDIRHYRNVIKALGCDKAEAFYPIGSDKADASFKHNAHNNFEWQESNGTLWQLKGKNKTPTLIVPQEFAYRMLCWAHYHGDTKHHHSGRDRMYNILSHYYNTDNFERTTIVTEFLNKCKFCQVKTANMKRKLDANEAEPRPETSQVPVESRPTKRARTQRARATLPSQPEQPQEAFNHPVAYTNLPPYGLQDYSNNTTSFNSWGSQPSQDASGTTMTTPEYNLYAPLEAGLRAFNASHPYPSGAVQEPSNTIPAEAPYTFMGQGLPSYDTQEHLDTTGADPFMGSSTVFNEQFNAPGPSFEAAFPQQANNAERIRKEFEEAFGITASAVEGTDQGFDSTAPAAEQPQKQAWEDFDLSDFNFEEFINEEPFGPGEVFGTAEPAVEEAKKEPETTDEEWDAAWEEAERKNEEEEAEKEPETNAEENWFAALIKALKKEEKMREALKELEKRSRDEELAVATPEGTMLTDEDAEGRRCWGLR